MGCSESSGVEVVDHEGRTVVNRRCICLICPPSFEISRFLESKPEQVQYRYISVGKVIRDEINKRTHYSQIIMDNLTKHKKLNNNILQVLLKNIALQGNFIIQYAPKDSEDIAVWAKFLQQVQVDLVVVISPEHKSQPAQQKLLLEEKMKNYYREIKSVKEMVKGDVIKHVENDSDIWASIVREINLKTREEAAGESANP